MQYKVTQRTLLAPESADRKLIMINQNVSQEATSITGAWMLDLSRSGFWYIVSRNYLLCNCRSYCIESVCQQREMSRGITRSGGGQKGGRTSGLPRDSWSLGGNGRHPPSDRYVFRRQCAHACSPGHAVFHKLSQTWHLRPTP